LVNESSSDLVKWGFFKMKLNWDRIPIEIACPACQERIDTYENLTRGQWQYIIVKNPDPLRDYHKCPYCQRIWVIIEPHSDDFS
jgi:hypothetical protein